MKLVLIGLLTIILGGLLAVASFVGWLVVYLGTYFLLLSVLIGILNNIDKKVEKKGDI